MKPIIPRRLQVVYFILVFMSFSAHALNVAISSAPSNLNPFFATDANSQNINRMLHLSLLDIDQNMKPSCVACKSFEEIHENGRYQIVFDLKDDLRFWDGSAVTGDDVINSWKYFTDTKEIKSVFRFAFSKIEKVELLSSKKVRLTYKQYSADALADLSLLKIIKKNNKGDFIGAGQYELTFKDPLNIVLKNRQSGRVVHFKVVKDETTLVLKIMKEEVDLSVATLSPRKQRWLEKQGKHLKFFNKSGTNYIYVALNQGRELLKDLKFRKALHSLIPVHEIIKYKIGSTAQFSNGLFSPSFKDLYLEQDIKTLSASERLKVFTDLGFKKGENGYFEKGGKTLTLDWVVSNNKSSIETVKVIKSYLEKGGIKINLFIQEWGTFLKSYKKGRYDLLMSQWVGFTGPSMMTFAFHSKNLYPKGGNRIGYQSTSVDKALDLAALELHGPTRNKLYRQAYRLVKEDLPYISLWHPKINWVARKCVEKLTIYPTGSFLGFNSMEERCE